MEQRMYCLAERHLSPIQKAIQSAHAIVEYTRNYFHTIECSKWMDNDKTIIILDGGTSEELVGAIVALKDHGIRFAEFFEPDMGGFRTAICFLAPETVWDAKTWGKNYDDYGCTCCASCVKPMSYTDWLEKIGGAENEILKDIIFSKRLAM